jgi:nucleoid-associated protein YgaU
MTSDAKIGLLLGLVFIVIIAVIINGLPSFWSHPSTANATPGVSKSNDIRGVTGSAQDAQRKLDWQKELDTSTVALKGASATPPAADTPSPETVVAKDDLNLGQTPLTSGQLSVAVDEGIKKLTDSLKSPQTASPPMQPKSELLVDTGGSKTQQATSLTPTNKDKKAVATPPLAKNDKTTPISPTLASGTTKQTVKEYVVQPGDDLGTIAKKVYGSVGGNVDRIFEFNRNTLKSKDVVTPGQKLRIPPLPASTNSPSPVKPEDALPASQFKKVPAVGNPALVDTKTGSGASSSLKPAVMTSSASGTDGRSYVVQADDNLWKIAASQLGSGARYDEIVKLNTAVLKNKDSLLTVGMRLKLPAK